MNYIKQLQKDLRATSYEQTVLITGLTDLVAYLDSPKFYCGDKLDGYVQVNDVRRRIEEAINTAQRAVTEDLA